MAGINEGFGKPRKISTENRQFLNTFNLGSVSLVTIALLLHLSPFIHSSTVKGHSAQITKRSPSVTDISGDDGYIDYPGGAKYDEFPLVVPKRAALIFDRILKGLQSASENNPFVNDWSPVTRRGNSKDKLYFRCYFNAVSCYKKK
ncbi:UNVERIFIED_CONTAM: hypothetical protein PYX00_010675 [Menopon gallinae]|uniref:Uncharacterized protein n=1 Tax=Menopon gallinae TaxID=328185 RepID=A0AAW2HG81_9NEOP